MNLRLIVLATSLLAATPAFSGTKVVAKSGTDSANCGSTTAPCLTIQHAINNSTNNGKVIVYPGTYAENITISTVGLKLESLSGQHATKIHSPTAQGINIDASRVQVGRRGKGFTVSADGSGGTPPGCITSSLNNTANFAKIEGNHMFDCTSGVVLFDISKPQVRFNSGAGLFAGITLHNVSRPLVSDNEIRDSTGHGIWADFGDNISLLRNKIVGVEDGFGIYLRDNQKVTVKDNVVTNSLINIGDFLSGGYYLSEISQSTVQGNISSFNDKDGMVLTAFEATNQRVATIRNNLATGNETGFVIATPVKFENNSAIHNKIGVTVQSAEFPSVFNDTITKFKKNNTYGNVAGFLSIGIQNTGDDFTYEDHFFGSDGIFENPGLISGTTVTKPNTTNTTKASGL